VAPEQDNHDHGTDLSNQKEEKIYVSHNKENEKGEKQSK